MSIDYCDDQATAISCAETEHVTEDFDDEEEEDEDESDDDESVFIPPASIEKNLDEDDFSILTTDEYEELEDLEGPSPTQLPKMNPFGPIAPGPPPASKFKTNPFGPIGPPVRAVVAVESPQPHAASLLLSSSSSSSFGNNNYDAINHSPIVAAPPEGAQPHFGMDVINDALLFPGLGFIVLDHPITAALF